MLLTDQCCGWALGNQGWRDQHLAMEAWVVVVAGCGSGLGSFHEPGEVPSTLCSYQQSMDVEWCVIGTATHKDLAL